MLWSSHHFELKIRRFIYLGVPLLSRGVDEIIKTHCKARRSPQYRSINRKKKKARRKDQKDVLLVLRRMKGQVSSDPSTILPSGSGKFQKHCPLLETRS